MKTHIPLLLFGLVFCAFVGPLVAADKRIDRALALGKRTENLVFRERVVPHWLPGEKSFWYKVETGPKSHEYVLIDAESGRRTVAATLAGLGLPEPEPIKSSETTVELRKTAKTGESSGIKFVNKLDRDVELFWINQDGEHVAYGSIRAGAERQQHTFEGHVWLVADAAKRPLAVIEGAAEMRTLLVDGPGREASARPRRGPRGASSPDGKWSAVVERGRVTLVDRQRNTTVHIQTEFDGRSPFHGQPAWSPDSSAFVVWNAPEVPQRKVVIVESSPKNELQPKLKEFTYQKPGDPLPQPVPVVFRVGDEGPRWLKVDSSLFATPFASSPELNVVWSPDGSEFYFDYNQRGHQVYRIIGVDAATGRARTVVEETSSTFIDYTNKTWRHWLHSSGELLWMSERDGWCHLWLYDSAAGTVKNQVTRGPWVVREVLHVDEAQREVWFMAGGVQPGEDPYHKHLCRVKFDGSGFQRLTEADGQHRVSFSPGREYFIDSWSRVDHPPVHELRRSSDGRLVCVLEKADAGRLLASGWKLPERFAAKGRDGKTDIYGIIIKPTDFDPAKRYPVIEEIYAGPHSAFVPKEFGRLLRESTMAELGFVLVRIDGMGTNHRGKAFHDVCWKNLKDAGFPDRIAWIKAAAATRPWLDLSRVGIYGGSAGGQNAMRALLDHGDFYRVAVADCGCHDNRMDKIWWNEQWMGWPVDESYQRSSNAEDAHKLQGRLLLIVGELDTNVDPASTMQVVGALQRAGKSFDFMPIVGAGHGAAETPYGSRLRMEFFLRHLQP